MKREPLTLDDAQRLVLRVVASTEVSLSSWTHGLDVATLRALETMGLIRMNERPYVWVLTPAGRHFL